MNTEIKKRQRQPDTVTLSSEVLEKVTQWIRQAETELGVRVNRKQMVNWKLSQLTDQLSSVELRRAYQEFYDEEAFLKMALAEIRKAKSEGRSLSLDAIRLRYEKPKRKKRSNKTEKVSNVGF